MRWISNYIWLKKWNWNNNTRSAQQIWHSTYVYSYDRTHTDTFYDFLIAIVCLFIHNIVAVAVGCVLIFVYNLCICRLNAFSKITTTKIDLLKSCAHCLPYYHSIKAWTGWVRRKKRLGRSRKIHTHTHEFSDDFFYFISISVLLLFLLFFFYIPQYALENLFVIWHVIAQ